MKTEKGFEALAITQLETLPDNQVRLGFEGVDGSLFSVFLSTEALAGFTAQMMQAFQLGPEAAMAAMGPKSRAMN